MTQSSSTSVSAANSVPRFRGDLAVYQYVRHQVTAANASIDPTVISLGDSHFDRLIRATDNRGRHVFSIDPRCVEWHFGCRNLPEGSVSISFGRRVYIAWDYDPTDPVVTRLMAYELARVAQVEKAGGELAFARRYFRKSLQELFDSSTGRQSKLKRQRDAAVRALRQWTESQTELNSNESVAGATADNAAPEVSGAAGIA